MASYYVTAMKADQMTEETVSASHKTRPFYKQSCYNWSRGVINCANEFSYWVINGTTIMLMLKV